MRSPPLRGAIRLLIVLSVLLGLPAAGLAAPPTPALAPVIQPAKVRSAPPAATPVASEVRPEKPSAAPAKTINTPPRAAAPAPAAEEKVVKQAAQAPPPARGPPAVGGAKAPYEMALGLTSSQGSAHVDGWEKGWKVERFARKVGAKTYGDLHEGSWNPGSLEKLQENITAGMFAAKKLHFNLDAFDLHRFREYAALPHEPTEVIGPKNITNWELRTVLTTPELLRKTTFYSAGGKIVAAPRFLEAKATPARKAARKATPGLRAEAAAP